MWISEVMPHSENVWNGILFLEQLSATQSPEHLKDSEKNTHKRQFYTRIWKSLPVHIMMYPGASWPPPCQLSCSDWYDSMDRELACPFSHRWKNEWFHDLHLHDRAGDKVVPVQSGKEDSYSPISSAILFFYIPLCRWSRKIHFI